MPIENKGFAEAVEVLANNYAAEILRDEQKFAYCRGVNLTVAEIGKIFLEAKQYMISKITKTATTNDL